jgi:hypothetical protein
MATTLVAIAGGAGPKIHETTLPPSVNASALLNEAEMATTFVNPAGTVDGLPHATTTPLLRSARLNPLPAAMAAAFVKLEGADVCPLPLFPQPATAPVFLKARL